MNSKELYSIREWSPLTEIIERIPARVQKGLFPVDLNITCIDAIPGYLALGSDAGIVFWYNRYNGDVQKLRAESASRITCVKIVDSVEYMVAAGNSSGQVSVFQIQKELPADLDMAAPCTRSKPIQRYTIRDLHRCSVTCCEWSKNGMKLYSGDLQGVVVLTEFDYQLQISKSFEILNEAYEVIQLSIYQSCLLVSTIYRSIIYQQKQSSNEGNITQVGKKDRKQLVGCGGVFVKRTDKKHPSLICGRPGLRFWIADIEGNVEKTLLFKDAVASSPTWQIPILNPKNSSRTPSKNQSAEGCTNFNNLHLYDGSETLVVTYDDNATLYILNIDDLSVEAIAKGFRKIMDISVCEKEIFILEGERSLLRLAPMPEKPNKTTKIIFNPLMPPPVPLLGMNTFESTIQYESDEEAVINAEECFELSPIEDIHLNIPIELAVESPRAEQNRRLEIFQQISDLDFDQSILHHSNTSIIGRKKRKSAKATKDSGIVEIGKVVSVDAPHKITKETTKDLEMTINQPTLMDASFCTKTKPSVKEAVVDKKSMNTFESEIDQFTIDSNAQEVPLDPISDKKRKNSYILSTPNADQQQEENLWQLPLTYPRPCPSVEEAFIQTTLPKDSYNIRDEHILNAGEPVDDMCNALYRTTIQNDDLSENGRNHMIVDPDEHRTLKFISSHPVGEEIDSFLIDFRRAGDPMRVSPPASGDSNTSSEWEFLDN